MSEDFEKNIETEENRLREKLKNTIDVMVLSQLNTLHDILFK